jgi:hypothetical protein
MSAVRSSNSHPLPGHPPRGQAELAGVQDQSDRVVHARGPTLEPVAFTLREVSLGRRRTMKDTSGW